MIRIGCVPYLNGVPLSAWFESPECDADVSITYLTPSELGSGLNEGRLDVAMVSIFQLFITPSLQLVPGISVSADGPVRSVRLYSRVPPEEITSVGMDTGSLTSAALVRILLKELYGITPCYVPYPPNLDAMLETNDAGLIIGDLKLFDSPAQYILDLGENWKKLTGMPFVYAGWLARPEIEINEVTLLLTQAKEWGIKHIDELAYVNAQKLKLPLHQVEEYFNLIMQYDLDERKMDAVRKFHAYCIGYKLVPPSSPNCSEIK